MRITETFLDLRTMADRGHPREILFGGRRCLQVLGNRVLVSHVAPAREAGIGIGYPELEYAIFCLPDGSAETRQKRPIDPMGSLDVSVLTPGHRYWLEFTSFGLIYVDREDSDGTNNRWCWSFPLRSGGAFSCA